jgi:hypothetical protein
MYQVIALPVIKGRKGQNAADITQDYIGAARYEERGMRAIVKKDKDPHQKQRGQNHQRDNNVSGVVPVNHVNEYRPKPQVGNKRVDHLQDRLADVGFCKGG